jgi:hypothetical protein
LCDHGTQMDVKAGSLRDLGTASTLFQDDAHRFNSNLPEQWMSRHFASTSHPQRNKINSSSSETGIASPSMIP